MNRMSIHQQITSFASDISRQISEIIEKDCINLINENGYSQDQLELCFYRNDPLHYSIRIENKILLDRWFRFDYTCIKERENNE